MLRRSGIAIGLVAELIEWEPDVIVQVGIGCRHQEVDVFQEAWPDAKIIGFEPHPDIAKGLRKDYPGELYGCGLGERSGKVSLYSKSRHKDGSSLFPHIERDDEKYKTIEVWVSTLDLMFHSEFKIGEHILLWIDCEGNELNVLKGGKEFIKTVEIVNVEMTAKPPGIGWCDPVDVHRWLTDRCGFFRQWIHTQRTAEGQYDAIYVRPRLFRPEYCCCPYAVEDHRNWKAKRNNDDQNGLETH